MCLLIAVAWRVQGRCDEIPESANVNFSFLDRKERILLFPHIFNVLCPQTGCQDDATTLVIPCRATINLLALSKSHNLGKNLRSSVRLAINRVIVERLGVVK